MIELDPVSAVSSADPYSYYAQLARERPYYHDERLSMWVASGASEVQRVLADLSLRVRPRNEPVPNALLDTPVGQVFSQMARWTEGDHHKRVKESLNAFFSTLDWKRVAVGQTLANTWIDSLAPTKDRYLESVMYGAPVLVVASLAGLPANDATLIWARQFVEALRANASSETVALGDDGVASMALALRQRKIDEETANMIGLLFQSFDATAGLIGNTLVHLQRGAVVRSVDALVEHVTEHDPAVHNTRRFGEHGTTLVVLASAKAPFGSGRHACPASSLARRIATETVKHVLTRGLDSASIEHDGYVASPNCRIPRLHLR